MLTEAEQREALDIARRAATEPLWDGAAGAGSRGRWLPWLDELRGVLRDPGACFVTLRTDGRLQGCIGSLVAHRPLGLDVAANAAAAAFDDPRLPALTPADVPTTEVHVSILGALCAPSCGRVWTGSSSNRQVVERPFCPLSGPR